MERRSFLGILASIPLLAGFKSQVSKDEMEQYFKVQPIKREPLQPMVVAHGGKIPHCSGMFIGGSGIFIV